MWLLSSFLLVYTPVLTGFLTTIMFVELPGARNDICQRCPETIVPDNAENSKGSVLYVL